MSLNACGVESSTGATLFYKDPADDTHKAMGNVTALPQFAFTHGTASCNTDDANENGWETFHKNGKKNGGSSTVGFNWKPGDAVQDLMWAAFDGTDTSEFRMQWSDAASTTLDFKANVTGYNKDTPVSTSDDNTITKSIAVQLSGEPIWG